MHSFIKEHDLAEDLMYRNVYAYEKLMTYTGCITKTMRRKHYSMHRNPNE